MAVWVGTVVASGAAPRQGRSRGEGGEKAAAARGERGGKMADYSVKMCNFEETNLNAI